MTFKLVIPGTPARNPKSLLKKYKTSLKIKVDKEEGRNVLLQQCLTHFPK